MLILDHSEGREEGKALNILELLENGEISFTKAWQKIDQLKSKTPDAGFWQEIYESLAKFKDPSQVKEPTAKYRPGKKKRQTPKS